MTCKEREDSRSSVSNRGLMELDEFEWETEPFDVVANPTLLIL
jgi:hypothetical protein